MTNCKIIVYKKKGKGAFFNQEKDCSLVLKECLTEINLNKKEDTSTAEATIKFQYENIPIANFAGGAKGIIDNFAKIQVLINDKIQFTGVIKRYVKNTETKIMTLYCHDLYYRMNNKCNKKLIWNQVYASNIIKDVCEKHAGLELKILGGEDYIVNKLECDVGTRYHDIIANLIQTMHCRIRCSKNGIILLEYQYPPYDEKYHEKNHYDFYYKTDINVSEDSTSSRDATCMYNLLKIICGNKWVLYEDEVMTTYLNGEYWLTEIENPLATTEALKFRVAGQKFLDFWRESTAINILPCTGNDEIDIGKVVKLMSQGYSGYYLIIGIDTVVDSSGYRDTLQLRGMRDAHKIYRRCIKVSEGIIESKDDKKKDIASKDEEVKMEVYLGDSSTTGVNNIGYIDVSDNSNNLEVTLKQLDKKEEDQLWFCIIDPRGVEYGQMGKVDPFYPAPMKPNPDGSYPAQPSIGRNEYYCKNEHLKSCSKLEYTGLQSNPQTWTITKPMKGKWNLKVYSYQDEPENGKVKFIVKSNYDWKIINREGKKSI